MDLYSLNKSAIKRLPELNDEGIENLKQEITSWWNKVDSNSGYFMLLGRDINYYTMFRWYSRSDECLADIVIECLNNIGKIKTWETSKEKIELWIEMPKPADECICLYLFPYDCVELFGG